MAGMIIGHPEWAGLALRWADGKLMTVQLDPPDRAHIELEQLFDRVDSWLDEWRTPKPSHQYMRFSVEGLILPWQAQWRDNPAKPAGILDYRKAIEE